VAFGESGMIRRVAIGESGIIRGDYCTYKKF